MGRFDPLFRCLRLLAVIVACMGVLTAPAVMAQSLEHGAEAEHGTAPDHTSLEAVEQHDPAEAGTHGGGLPQLDPSTFASQVFWLIIAFLTLFFLLRRRALPRVAEILEARQDRIAADLDRAAKLRADAEEALRRYETIVAEAHAKASAELKATQERMAAEAARRQAAIDAELQQKLTQAEAQIAAAKQAALAQVQDVAAEVAQLAVERLAGLKLSTNDVKAALDRAMAEAA